MDKEFKAAVIQAISPDLRLDTLEALPDDYLEGEFEASIYQLLWAWQEDSKGRSDSAELTPAMAARVLQFFDRRYKQPQPDNRGDTAQTIAVFYDDAYGEWRFDWDWRSDWEEERFDDWKCKKGKPCKGRCIAQSKTCRGEGIAEEKKPKAKALKEKAKKEPKPRKPKGQKEGATSTQTAPTEEATQATTSTRSPSSEATPTPSPSPDPTPSPTSTSEGDFPNRLKPRIDEDAIPDFSEQDVIDYVQDKAFLSRQDNPKAAHNMSYEEWRGDRKLSRKTYKEDLEESVRKGFYVSEERWADAGRGAGKNQQEANERNRLSIEQRRERVAPVDRILDKPLVSEEAARNHKPFMSEDEARAYTKDSFTGDWDFYHGATPEAIDSITTDGVRVDANQNGTLGGGFYMGTSRATAEYYSQDNGDHISAKVNMRNPYVLQPGQSLTNDTLQNWYDNDGGGNLVREAFGTGDFATRFGAPSGTPQAIWLRVRGHDGIYQKESGYLVAFDPRQVAPYSRQRSRTISELDSLGIGVDLSKPGTGFGLEREQAFNQMLEL